MKYFSPFASRFLMTLFAVFLIQTSAGAEPDNIGLIKKQLIQYHDSGTYQKELSDSIQKARQYIIQQATNNPLHQKLALVLDIDETSLSNYKHILNRDFSSKPQEINREIMKADAIAIEPMLHLYKDALHHHIKIFFVTGRSEAQSIVTIKNLHAAGYQDWSGIYFRSPQDKHHSAIQYKSKARADITKKGYTIIASIGDQYSDIKGGYAQKGFKLPNPFYYLP